jgi:effector-binding domain-containing protein
MVQTFKMFTTPMHYYIGFMIQEETQENQEMKPHHFKPKKYLTYTHIGPYQKLGSSYTKIYQYAADNQIKVDQKAIEIYISDPSQTPSNELETQIYITLKDS